MVKHYYNVRNQINLFFNISDVFYFSVFSGRDILIEENSLLGDFCQYVQCGYKYLSDEIKRKARNSRLQTNLFDQFTLHMQGQKLLTERLIYTGQVADFTGVSLIKHT